MKHMLVGILATLSGSVLAGTSVTPTVAEPGSFELLAIAGVVAVVVAFRNRRK